MVRGVLSVSGRRRRKNEKKINVSRNTCLHSLCALFIQRVFALILLFCTHMKNDTC